MNTKETSTGPRYRRRKGMVLWHWDKDCPLWPDMEYDEIQTIPPEAYAQCHYCKKSQLINEMKNVKYNERET